MKEYRLSGAELRAKKPERRVHGTCFSLSVLPGSRTQYSCVVSKKVSAKAVERNLVKRRCRAALTKYRGRLPKGAYVFSAKKEAKEATYAEIERDIIALIGRLAPR